MARRLRGPMPSVWRTCHVPSAAAALHPRDRHPESPPGRRRLERPRSGARGAGLYAREQLAQSLDLPAGPCGDRSLPRHRSGSANSTTGSSRSCGRSGRTASRCVSRTSGTTPRANGSAATATRTGPSMARGLMHTRIASINDLPITEAERLYHWPAGRRPDDHAGLTALGL